MSRARAILITEAERPVDLLKRRFAAYPADWPKYTRWYNRGKWGKEEPSRKVASNTYHVWYKDKGKYALRLHDTDIITYEQDGSVTVNVGLWTTKLTAERINPWLPYGWRLDGTKSSGNNGGRGSYGGETGWYWYNTQWPQEVRWALYKEHRRKSQRWWHVPFHNGDQIEPGGRLITKAGTAAWPDGTIQPKGRSALPPDLALRSIHLGPKRRKRGDVDDPRQFEFNFEHLLMLREMGLLSESYLDRLRWIKRVQAKHDTMGHVEWLKKQVDPKNIRKAKPAKDAPQMREAKENPRDFLKKHAQRIQLPVGFEASSGTLQTDDLIEAGVTTLEHVRDFNSASNFKDEAAEARAQGWDLEDVLARLFDYISREHTPPFTYFGSHPGSGADIGVWPYDSFGMEEAQAMGDLDIMKVADPADVEPRWDEVKTGAKYVLMQTDQWHAAEAHNVLWDAKTRQKLWSY